MKRLALAICLLLALAVLLVATFTVIGQRQDSLRDASRDACAQVNGLRDVLRGVLLRGEAIIKVSHNLSPSQRIQGLRFYRGAIHDLASHDCGAIQ